MATQAFTAFKEHEDGRREKACHRRDGSRRRQETSHVVVPVAKKQKREREREWIESECKGQKGKAKRKRKRNLQKCHLGREGEEVEVLLQVGGIREEC